MSVRLLNAVLLGVALGAAVLDGAIAQETLAFTLPADDGYGIDDCLQSGSACGEVLATSFCQAHGHVKALAFGAADVTGTTPGIAHVAVNADAVSIRCGD